MFERARLSLEPLWRGDRLAWLLCLAYGGYAASLLTSLDYNFDEGVYIQQARLIFEGQLPYVDFFYHQTPLYPFTLWVAGAGATESLFAYRLPSLIATALCGFLVYRIALRLMPKGAALLAALLFYSAPLQFFGLMALPNALMGCLATAGVYLLWFRPEASRGPRSARAASILGGCLLGLSILYKPLSLPTALAVGIGLLASRESRPRVGWLVLGGASVGLGAWAFFHLLSEGRFTQLLGLQLSRYTGGSGFDVMRGFEPFRQVLDRMHLDSALAWNVYEHTRTFLDPGPHANFHLAALAAAGQLLLLSPWGRRWSRQRVFLSLWWGLPLAFSIAVWEPSWDHYFVQYLAPFAILAALFLQRVWSLPKGRVVARVAVVAVVAYAAGLGPNHLNARRVDYEGLAKPSVAEESWLLFDPFLNFVTKTRPACGIIDPFNVYGERSLAAISDAATWSRHRVSVDGLIECLERDPEIKIGSGGVWGAWFEDGPLASYLEGLPEERFFVLWPHRR
jgi:4-amino-4-deoxy-L-arabinose transferase-like glycosyltransferase